jgi:hypothetical protein
MPARHFREIRQTIKESADLSVFARTNAGLCSINDCLSLLAIAKTAWLADWKTLADFWEGSIEETCDLAPNRRAQLRC